MRLTSAFSQRVRTPVFVFAGRGTFCRLALDVLQHALEFDQHSGISWPSSVQLRIEVLNVHDLLRCSATDLQGFVYLTVDYLDLRPDFSWHGAHRPAIEQEAQPLQLLRRQPGGKSLLLQEMACFFVFDLSIGKDLQVFRMRPRLVQQLDVIVRVENRLAAVFRIRRQSKTANDEQE
jgi:hypothetical protein